MFGYDIFINDLFIGFGILLFRFCWLLDLINDGVVVQLKLKIFFEMESLQMGVGVGIEGEGKDKNDFVRVSYIYQGEEIVVQDEKCGKY